MILVKPEDANGLPRIHAQVSLFERTTAVDDQILPHIRKTHELVDRAYPEGVPPEDYLALLFVFSEYLCDENLAILAEHVRKDGLSGLNDALKTNEREFDTRRVMPKLEEAGFEAWVAEQ